MQRPPLDRVNKDNASFEHDHHYDWGRRRRPRQQRWRTTTLKDKPLLTLVEWRQRRRPEWRQVAPSQPLRCCLVALTRQVRLVYNPEWQNSTWHATWIVVMKKTTTMACTFRPFALKINSAFSMIIMMVYLPTLSNVVVINSKQHSKSIDGDIKWRGKLSLGLLGGFLLRLVEVSNGFMWHSIRSSLETMLSFFVDWSCQFVWFLQRRRLRLGWQRRLRRQQQTSSRPMGQQ